MSTAIVATVMQTPTSDRLEVIDAAVVAVDDRGVITAVEPEGSEAGQRALGAAERVERLGDRTVLLPGLIDLHVHAPQWPQLGTCLDMPLERWLFEHTFPLEARYANPVFAGAVWPDLVGTLLRHGTTTAVYFGTNDTAATTALAAEAVRQGQRAFVGRVAMDHPEGTPEWYRDPSAAAGLEQSVRSIEEIRALDDGSGRVQPIITPRFVPACTDELLGGLGDLAASTGVLVQTHCSESDWEHGYALDRYGVTDSAALDRFGLLREGTVLAHGDHVTDDDAALIRGRRSGIAHCPLSNAYFANAVLPVRRLLDGGVPVGLGTDVAGGARAGVLQQCHDAVTMSRLLADGVDARLPAGQRGVAGSAIDTITAFWLATVGGAAVLGIPAGLLAPGRRFDAVAVDLGDPARAGSGSLRVWPEVDDAARTFEKVVRLAGPSDITHVWVDGRPVVSADAPR